MWVVDLKRKKEHVKLSSRKSKRANGSWKCKCSMAVLNAHLRLAVTSQLTGKDPDTGKDWRQKEKEAQRMRWLDSITNSMDMNFRKLWEIVEDRRYWYAAVHRVVRSWIPGVENGNPLQYSCLENSMDRGAWWTAVHSVTKSWTWLSTHTLIKSWTGLSDCTTVCMMYFSPHSAARV